MTDIPVLVVDVAILVAVLFEAVISWLSFKLRKEEARRDRRNRRKVSRV
jgi:hypothetical protein